MKGAARQVLVSYGEPVVNALAHFMRDPEEDIWVRRHIPGDAGADPVAGSRSTCSPAALEETDGFLRYKVIAALDRLRRTDAPLTFPTEKLGRAGAPRRPQFFNYLSLLDNLLRAKAARRCPARQGAPRRRWSGSAAASTTCSR